MVRTTTRREITLAERLEAEGIRRLGSPKRGFRYRHADRRPIGRADRARIDALRIPPAWTDVRIDPRPRAAVQAMGRDRKRRWQYLYHPARVARREREKAGRLVRFLEALPAVRRAVRRDLALPGMPREKVMAAIVRVLMLCFLRPGSRAYADENGSYGLATLRPRHVTTQGARVRFRFPGKSGKHVETELRDAALARIVRTLRAAPGEVFKFRGADGKWVDARRRHINVYLREIAGERFTAKDFRTWAGTLICACALARGSRQALGAISERDRKRLVAAAVRETAERLGNTPAVCRGSYIHRDVFASYARGRVIEARPGPLETLGSASIESALLALLDGRPSRSEPPARRNGARAQ